MPERATTPLPYFQHEHLAGMGSFDGQRRAMRLRVHTSPDDERGRDELLPKPWQIGPRAYLRVQAYSWEPHALEPRTARASRHRRPIGLAEAWVYPETHTGVLWTAYLFDAVRTDDPLAGRTLRLLWRGVERVLLAHYPTVERLVTPSWEDTYDTERWRAFLRHQGYQSFTNRAFSKAGLCLVVGSVSADRLSSAAESALTRQSLAE